MRAPLIAAFVSLVVAFMANEKAIRELGRMASRMNCRCSPGSVHPLASTI
jgi:hypothetical protein